MRSLLSIHCNDCAERNHSLFCHLDGALLDELHHTKAPNIYKRSQVIFYEGDVSTGCYCIQKGKVKIYKTDEEGHEQILGLAAASHLLGYRSVLTNECHSVTAEVLEDTTLCFIDKNMFLKIFQNHVQTAMEIASKMGEDLRHSGELSLHLAHKNIRERLSELLLILNRRFGIKNAHGALLDLRLSRREIANMIGTSEESVVRLLSEFKEDGLIEVDRRSITLLDANKLADLANLSS